MCHALKSKSMDILDCEKVAVAMMARFSLVVTENNIDHQYVEFLKRLRHCTPFYSHQFYKTFRIYPNKQLLWISRCQGQLCTCEKMFLWSFKSMYVGVCVCVCVYVQCTLTIETHMSPHLGPSQHLRFKGWEFKKQETVNWFSVIKDINWQSLVSLIPNL